MELVRIKTYGESLRTGELLTFLELRQQTFVDELNWKHMWSTAGLEIDQYDNMRHASLLLVGQPTAFACRMLHAKKSMVRTWLPQTYPLLVTQGSFEVSRRVNFRASGLKETRSNMAAVRSFMAEYGVDWYFAIADERVLKAYNATGIQPDRVDACPDIEGLFLAQWKTRVCQGV